MPPDRVEHDSSAGAHAHEASTRPRIESAPLPCCSVKLQVLTQLRAPPDSATTRDLILQALVSQGLQIAVALSSLHTAWLEARAGIGCMECKEHFIRFYWMSTTSLSNVDA